MQTNTANRDCAFVSNSQGHQPQPITLTLKERPFPGAWSLLDLYDGFTPCDKSDFYPTISFYDSLGEEEEEEEDDKNAVGGRDLEDENDLLLPSQKPNVGQGTGKTTSRWHAVLPQCHTVMQS